LILSIQISFPIPYLPIIFKLSALFTLVTLLLQVSAVDIPFFPDVYDTNATYVQGRCIDYCAFLRPAQICPRNPLDITCLCYVYDIRLPAVYNLHLQVLTYSVNNAGHQKMPLLRLTSLLSSAFARVGLAA